MKESRVVTCFLRHRGDVLLLRRSRKVGSYRGRWGGVAGYVEGAVDESAWREIAEETGLGEGVRLVRRGEPFAVDDESLETRWVVHPFLFDSPSRQIDLDWESTEAEWVSPTDIRRRETVPDLWTSYLRVAPTVASVREDREHGSTYLSLRALEVLRDRASDPDVRIEDLGELATVLATARPSMAVIARRIDRVMYEARGDVRSVEVEAHRGIARALEADEAAAHHAASIVESKRVLTLSRSETVTAALVEARPPLVVIAESRPGEEGVRVAEELTEAGLRVEVIPDAMLGAALSTFGVEAVLIGADAVLPSGGIVNKVGSRLAALAAGADQVPVYVVCAEDKVARSENVELEPVFEKVPGDLIEWIVTEKGTMTPAEIPAVFEALEELSDWRGGG